MTDGPCLVDEIARGPFPGVTVGPGSEKTATVRRFTRPVVIGVDLSVPVDHPLTREAAATLRPWGRRRPHVDTW